MNLSITNLTRFFQLLFTIIGLLPFGTNDVFAQQPSPEKVVMPNGRVVSKLSNNEILEDATTNALMDYDQVYQKFARYKNYMQSMEDRIKQLDSACKKDIEEIDQQAAEQLKATGNSSIEERAAINRRAKEKKKDVQYYQHQKKLLLQDETKAGVKKFQKEMNEAVHEVMLELGYTRVFSVTGPGISDDITFYVIQKLNK
ncbi:OmpH family outer membrane protein [Chitinophagaceae bacterium 26-R-25]|nr:OmpH family outer membrane protein [Chitinophagaceae bacterium 26-R-25]